MPWGIATPGAGVWARMVPWSKCCGCSVWIETPVCVRLFSMACSIGAGPRKSGRSEGWTLRPPYCAWPRILGGTRSPKDTAMTRFIGMGGVQPVNVSMAWVGRLSSSVATCLIGTAVGQLTDVDKDRTGLPSLNVFSPRPVGFPGRWSTSMLCMSFGTSRFASARARSEAMLKLSEPQNNIRSGSEVRVEAVVELCRR
jgi:hypothetical protein